MPSAIRESISIFMDDANNGVKNVSMDHKSTANVSTFLPPNRFEKLAPIIFNVY
jgi:hypothetical protein